MRLNRFRINKLASKVYSADDRRKFMKKYDNPKYISKAIEFKAEKFLKLYSYIVLNNMGMYKKSGNLNHVDMEYIVGEAIIYTLRRLDKIHRTLEEIEFKDDKYNAFKVIISGAFKVKKRLFLNKLKDVIIKHDNAVVEKIASYDSFYARL